MKADIVQCPRCKTRLSVKRNEIDPEPIEVIAKAIIETAAAMRRIEASSLKRDTIVTLIHAHSKVGKRDIEIVLQNLTMLDTLWLKPNAR